MSGAPTRGEKTARGEVCNCPQRGNVTLAPSAMIVNKHHSVVAFTLETCGNPRALTVVCRPRVAT
jgi:hypothetical protein